MAAPPTKQPAEVIDLTLDDDDDDDDGSALAAPPNRTPSSTDGVPKGFNDPHATSISSDAYVPASPYFPGGPPPKRVKLANSRYGSNTAQAVISAYAQSGARQAVIEDHRLLEVVLRDKLRAELLRQFEGRITEQINQNGEILDSVHGDIIAVRRAVLSQLVTLPEYRQFPRSNNPAPAAPATPSPVPTTAVPPNTQPVTRKPLPAKPTAPVAPTTPALNKRPLMPYGVRSGSKPNGSRPPSASSPVYQTPSFPPPAVADGQPGPRESRNTSNEQTRYFVDLTIWPGGEPGHENEVHSMQPRADASPVAQLQPANWMPPPTTARQAPVHWLSASQPAASQPPVWQAPVVQPTSSLQRPLSRDTASESGPASTPRRRRQRRDAPSTPSSVKDARTNVNAPTTPQNFHARAKTAQWKADSSSKVETKPTSFFALDRRPYVGGKGKEAILRRNGRLSRLKPTLLQKPEIFHVDFALTEAHNVLAATRTALGKPEKISDDPYRDLAKLLKRLKNPQSSLFSLARNVSRDIMAREADDIHAFFDDTMNKRAVLQEQRVLYIEKDPFDKRGEDLRESRLTSLLLAREVSGNRYGGMRRLENFTNEFRKILENGLQIRSEFTNCAGDISTVSWISDQAYIAGTTVHMDSHNQQYNKPGNLVLGCISRGKAALKAYADHRIVRPIVHKGENSSSAMRETQDPWLYTSVVFSDYDPIHDRAYTSSFDQTVKAWKVDSSAGSMRCIGTWEHQGPVNFVQASLYEDSTFGLVATAADVPTTAVRIYRVGKNDDTFSASEFTPFSCSKINANDNPLMTDKWTYCPSTMKWGLENSVKHYLLVGYSPRSLSMDDGDIPLESLNTGELCLWDAITGKSVHIRGANSQNVFEVLWHPHQAVFIAATSSKGVDFKDNRVRTQVRIFGRSNEFLGDFSELKVLDCMAADINELTIRPNSVLYSYVTAGCTDGKTYVWDTALSDKPLHVLAHGPPIEGIRVNDAEDDTGVKFTAWGSSLDHFYTGSSDGVVKVWNVRSEKKDKGKVILEASAQISFGAFSPDRSKLVVGDASGRVFLLSVDEDDGKPPTFVKLPGALGSIKRRMPTEVEHHATPPPPLGVVNVSGISAAHDFLAARQLRDTGDPTVGVVQDANYASTGFFRREFHFDHDPMQELFAQYTVHQLDDTKIYSDALPSKTKRLRQVAYASGDAEESVDAERGLRALMKRHEENCKLDLKFENLSLEIRDLLSSDGIGQRELGEGLEYPGIVEDDEAELKRAKIEIPKEAQEE